MKSIKGMHHVSCIMKDIYKTVDFYTNVLGFQLIKKTIKINDVSNYHLYFSCNNESHNDVVTFFSSSSNFSKVEGTNCIDALSFLVNSEESLMNWYDTLSRNDVYVSDVFQLYHYKAFSFVDVNNIKVYFLHNPLAQSTRNKTIGLGPVMIHVKNMMHSMDWLTTHFHMKLVLCSSNSCLIENSNTQILLFQDEALPCEVGVGSIDHVAFEVESLDALQELSDELNSYGDTHSTILDRMYYHSLYVRDPNRILFEFVHHEPGYTVDESIHHLGEKLSIPVYLECFKEEILRQLPPLNTK